MDDMISRQEAIDLLKKWSDGYSYIEVETNSAIKAFEEMSSAQPQCKKGRWIPHESVFGGSKEMVYTCDQCGYNIGFHMENYCPRCGADTRGEK